jgi:hypothetical protein
VKQNKALRVALVWNGAVLQEETYQLPSDWNQVTIGGSRKNDFVVEGREVPENHVLFSRKNDGYDLDLLGGMSGEITLGGQRTNVAQKTGQSLSVKDGDWGFIHVGSISLFFQFVDTNVALFRRTMFSGMGGTLASAIWFSLLVQFTFVFVARLLLDKDLAAQEYELDERFLNIIAAAPPDEILDQEEDDALDETTSKRAGGEEGEFGEEDAEIEDSILPDHDGPLVQELEDTELGRALDAAIAQSGELSRIFQENSLLTGIGQDFATAGEGDVFIVGRGAGGMGLSGTGRGGGGSGFGRVHGVGEIDTGGGRGVSANLGRRGQRAPTARVDRGRASVSGFLSREQIERVVRRHSRGIRYCYERELQNDPTLGGRITANWTIDLDGTVSRRSVEENTMGNRSVESCLVREIGRMRFPEPDGGMVVVSYPFTFRGVTEE